MATTPIQTFGTAITFATTDIEQIQDISGPSESAESVDITNHDSPSAYREKVAVILDGGELSFDMVWTSETGQDTLRTAFAARTTGAVVVTVPGGTTFGFDGFVSGWDWSAPTAGVLIASITITVAGAVSVTPA